VPRNNTVETNTVRTVKIGADGETASLVRCDGLRDGRKGSAEGRYALGAEDGGRLHACCSSRYFDAEAIATMSAGRLRKVQIQRVGV
jgi:hypothetical protein